MSTLKVEVVEIKDIQKHPNADRLELAQILGWTCVVQKDLYKKGNKVLYIPVDSILPSDVEEKIFPPDSKIKLHKSRVRTIKLRGAISQGLVVPLDLFGLENKKVGTDVAEKLGIIKYEPPVKSMSMRNNQAVSYKRVNPYFYKYTDIENFKNYPDVFKDGEDVYVTEKIHGTNFRCGWVPLEVNSLWRKILKYFKLLPEWEFVYGSRNVQLQYKVLWSGYYKENLYYKIVKQYKLDEILKPGYVLYGEIYGWGVQKNYTYGCQEGEHKVVILDLMKINESGFGQYFSTAVISDFCKKKALDYVPLLYKGAFSSEKMKEISQGVSVLCPEQKVREGCVIKPEEEQACYMGRKVLKYLNDEYLLKDQTEFH